MFAYIAPTSILSIPLTVSNDIGAEKYLLSPAIVFRPSSSLKHRQPETEDGKGETNGDIIVTYIVLKLINNQSRL